MSSLISNFPLWYGNETQSSPCYSVGEGLHIAFCILVMLCGIPGNCLILRVYWSKPRKTSTHLLIVALAWADLFSCLLLVHAIITSCVFGIGETTPLGILRYFLLCAVTVSANVTSFIAFDRYDCVCRSNRRLFTSRRALVAVLIGILYSLVVTSIYFVVLIRPELDIIPLIMLLTQIMGYLVAAVMIVVCYGKVYQTIRRHVKVGAGATREKPTGEGVRLTQTNFKVSSVRANTSGDTAAPGVHLPAELGENEGQPNENTLSRDVVPGLSSNPDNGMHREGPKSPIQTTDQPITAPVAPSSGEHATRVPPKPNMPSTLQHKTTRMLLVTSVVFLVSWVPYWIFVASLLATLLGFPLSQTGASAVEKCAYLVYLNNAVNPFIYGIANRRFRKDSVEVLKQLRC